MTETKRLACSIQVQAGIVPGEPMAEYDRSWHFSSEEININYHFSDAQGAAMNYAAMIMNPQKVNWVTLTWIWF